MTKQIEQAYRNNRRRSWLLIAAVVALAAAIAIPIASGTSGGAGKYYTLGSDKSVCVGDTGVAVPLTLTNAAGSQTLGSANITFPGYVTVTGTTNGTREGNLVKLRNLNLAVGASLTFTVTITADAVGATSIAAIVKQANNFSGSGGSNLFDLKPQTSLPVLTAANCFGTISGKIWNDQNENQAKESYEVNQDGWTVRLYKKTDGAFTGTPTVTTTDTAGAYTFTNVKLGSDYLVCEEATPASDAAKSWHQTTPTDYADCTLGEPNGLTVTGFTAANANITDKNFGNAWSIVLPTCGGIADSNDTFTVEGGTAADANCKNDGSAPKEYVYEKWTDENGVQFAAFHPVSGDGVCNLGLNTANTCTYFVQKLIWTFTTDAQPLPAERALNYDDKKQVTDPTKDPYQYEAMKYCKKDPRTAATSDSELALAPGLGAPDKVATDVLPDGNRVIDGDSQSSCLITSTESTTTDGKIKRVDLVFTAVDGRSNIG